MTLGSHQKTIGKSQSWITPPWLIKSLGPFDLDPCAASPQPWPCAKESYTEGGLERPWHGVVWLNPPFDRREVGLWLEKAAAHRNCIVLVHARTETEWFRHIWREANAVLFLPFRIRFFTPEGKLAPANSGAPVVLAAFGDEVACRLSNRVAGVFVTKWNFT